jgi:hypothetical protein
METDEFKNFGKIHEIQNTNIIAFKKNNMEE